MRPADRRRLASGHFVPIACLLAAFVAPAPAASAAEPRGALDLGFFENRGQLDPAVRFATRAGGLEAYATANALVLQKRLAFPGGRVSDDRQEDLGGRVLGAVVALRIDGAAHAPEIVPEGRRGATVNFFIGADPTSWRTELPTYDRLRYRDVRPGVDLVIHAGGALEVDFEVAPGRDLGQLALRIEGADALEIDTAGRLIARTAIGAFVQERPHAYAVGAKGARRDVACRFRLLGGDRFAFDAPGRRAGERLVVDPSIAFASYVGGNDSDVFNGMAVGADGTVLLAGQTLSTNFPAKVGSFDTSFNGAGAGATDAIVVRMNADATALMYATFVGGATGEESFVGEFATDVAVDDTGRAIVVGSTTANDFPVTPGALQGTRKGTRDAVIFALAGDGASLAFSTYFGGKGAETAYALALGDGGAIHVGGITSSTDFPLVGSPFDFVVSGTSQVDGFLASFAANAAAISYTTYMGGFGDDAVNDVALDSQGRVAVVGETDSVNFPVFPGNLDVTQNGGRDAFAVLVDTGIGGLPLFSTYLGGTGNDEALSLAVAADDTLHVIGHTTSADFPMALALDPVFSGGKDAFVTRFAADGLSILHSTYLGGSGAGTGEEAHAITLTPAGTLLVVGVTDSSDFPVQGTAATGALNGATDMFLTEMSGDGQLVVYSTLAGGSSLDVANAAASGSDKTWIAGQTSSSNFPQTAGKAQATSGGGFSDAVVLQFGFDCAGSFDAYGFGCSGTGGFVPRLTAAGCPLPGAPFQVHVTQGLGGAMGFVFGGTGTDEARVNKECYVQIGPLVPGVIIPFVLDGVGAGQGTHEFIGMIPAFTEPGTLNIQAFFFDAGAPGDIDVSGTNALAVIIAAP